MPKKIGYEAIPGKIGAHEPYDKNAPDIVKLIHFGADIIVTQKVGHELMKEQLAFFLYAWPHIKQWLPEQNYKAVSDFAFAQWSVTTIKMKFPYASEPEQPDTSKWRSPEVAAPFLMLRFISIENYQEEVLLCI